VFSSFSPARSLPPAPMDDSEQPRLSALPGSSARRGSPGGRASERLRTLAGHVTQTLPFSAEALDGLLDLDEHVYLELKPNTRVYALACAYIAAHGRVQSFRYSPEKFVEDDGLEAPAEASTYTTIGLGMFPFQWKEHSLHGLHQTLGQPVGTGSQVDVYTSLVLFAPRESPGVLGQFCHELVAESERAHAGFVSVFEWQALNQFWQARVICPARPLHTVVLEKSVKDRLLEDLEEFLGTDTRQWYKEHGIQHKRGYLLYGVPGTGKTSLIQAIASQFEHNLCHVHLTHPHLTDESLRAAVNQAPRRSLLIFEDVDAIFGKDREKLISDSPLTFSGLLNALDGVGKADGQIFLLTTNHRERLNPALIRNGRADVHIEFTHATDEQIAGMYMRFYPFATLQLRQRFVERLRVVLAGRFVTTAALQHYFIAHRRSSAADAIDAVQEVVDELELRADEQRLLEEDLERKKADRNGKAKK